ncbi:hypothetical protein ABK040_002644 [Willaertia magna]
MRSLTFTIALLLIITCSFALGARDFRGIGDRLLHTFFSKTPVPLNETSVTSDWESLNGGGCVSGLGRGYLKERIVIWFTSKGQFSGFGVQLHGNLPKNTIPGYWRQIGNELYQLDIATRDPSFSCSGKLDLQGGVVGDRVVVSPQGAKFEVPILEKTAQQQNWTSGGCIEGMGRHWGYDFTSKPHLSGHASSLMPVIPMYHEGFISAVLVFTHEVQKVWPVGNWEGPFNPTLFCYNFCTDECMKHESTFSFYTTLHFLFHDASENKCDSRCPNGYKHKRLPGMSADEEPTMCGALKHQLGLDHKKH